MNIEEGRERGVTSGNSHQPGVANYPPQSVIGFPQQIPPSAPPPPPQFYAHGFPQQISPSAPPPPPHDQFYAHGFPQQISPSAPPPPPQFYAHGFPQQISPSAPPPPPHDQFYAHGFPQQISPSAPPPPPQFYAHGYQAGQGYPVSEGIPTEKVYGPLPCCGMGIGWFLFILGLFVGVIPWYVGAIILLCNKGYDKREKPGLIACAIIGVIATIVIVVAVAYHHQEYSN